MSKLLDMHRDRARDSRHQHIRSLIVGRRDIIAELRRRWGAERVERHLPAIEQALTGAEGWDDVAAQLQRWGVTAREEQP